VKEDVDLQEFVGGFIAESDQLVASANAGLLEIEQANARGESRPRTVRDLFRALHTIKGLAGMMGIEPIVEIAHALETVIRAADQAGGRLSAPAVELGLLALHTIAERVRAVADQRPVARAPEPLLDELARVDAVGGTAVTSKPLAAGWDRNLSASEREQVATAIEAGRKVYALTFTPSDANSARGITIARVRAAVDAIAEIVKVSPRSLPASDEAPAGLRFEMVVISDATPAQLAEASATTPDRVIALDAKEPSVLPELPIEEPVSPIGRSFVRVELARLDELQDQLSALVVSRFRLERQIALYAAAGHDVRALRDVAELQGRQLRELRGGSLRARMVRVAEVLEPLTLLVRSLVKPGLKEVRLELDVGDTELDKAVADRLLPALVHLVRNAVDHAIEPIGERERLGKPRAGRVTICCRSGAGNQLELVIHDDGRGIDRAEIARRVGRALEDDAALLQVLTTPGFSTRDHATQTSGRGLGMDIVRRVTTRDLGGELALRTELGAGTTFTLRIPLTIAIIDVFSFECAHQSFVVPVAIVEEIVDLGEQRGIEGPTGARERLPVTVCERRGHALPVVSLGALLRIDHQHEPTMLATREKTGLVVRRNGEPMAFAVDRMLGRHEVVVRPIEDVLARAPGVVGATDLGDGHPTLLLDLVELGASITAWRSELTS
jgi:two-component system chemotaxis sensor kinase CheA